MFPSFRLGDIERAQAAALILLKISWSHGDAVSASAQQTRIRNIFKMSRFVWNYSSGCYGLSRKLKRTIWILVCWNDVLNLVVCRWLNQHSLTSKCVIVILIHSVKHISFTMQTLKLPCISKKGQVVKCESKLNAWLLWRAQSADMEAGWLFKILV